MKVGKVEGSPEEIKNIFENNGLNLEDYLEKLEKADAPLHWSWLSLPGFIFIASLLFLVLLTDVSPKTRIVFLLVGAGGICWLAAAVQIRFKNPVATSAVGMGLFLMLLVAAGFLTPKETIDTLKGLKDK